MVRASYKQKLEADLRIECAKQGIAFSQLSLNSVAKELGLLEQIEINYPSRMETEIITVEHPDPHNRDRMLEAKVERQTRVMMTEDETIEYRKRQLEEGVFELYQTDPERVKELLAKFQPKPKSGVVKKPVTKKVAKKPKGGK